MHTYNIIYYVESPDTGKVEMKPINNYCANSKIHARSMLQSHVKGFAGIQSIIQTN